MPNDDWNVLRKRECDLHLIPYAKFQSLSVMYFLVVFPALSLDKETGNFEVGKDFDALRIDPTASESPFDVFSDDDIEVHPHAP